MLVTYIKKLEPTHLVYLNDTRDNSTYEKEDT